MVATYAGSNLYPSGQCTYWASKRYHDKTGHYVPAMGDAHSWASQALLYGWKVTNTPPTVPSIICLQPFIQGAGSLGHVGVVEQVNAPDTVTASNLNWGMNASQRSSVQQVVFKTGIGVSFLYGDTQGTLGMPLPGLLPGILPGVTASATAVGSALDMSVLGPWLQNPLRIVKLATGILALGGAVYLFFEPDISKIAGTVGKVAVLA